LHFWHFWEAKMVKQKKQQKRRSGVMIWLREDDYGDLQRVAQRDRRKPTRWAHEALLRTLRRALRDEAR
jgi:hypothetical protein